MTKHDKATDSDMQFLEECLATGRLTKEGYQHFKVLLEAAQHIDPETAEIKSEDVPFLDPYGVFLDIPNDHNVRRHYFARAPGSDIWVAWEHLPLNVEFGLWRKHKETDPALCDPLSCWPSFCHSRYFRDDVPDQPITENHVRYVRLILWGYQAEELRLHS